MNKVLVLVFFLFVFIGCVNNEPMDEAVLYSIDRIRSSPDFHWFNWEYDLYNYEQDVVDSISSRFTNSLKVVIFTAPSCYCGSLYTKFPQLIKVLEGANINSNNYEIYVTIDTGNKLRFGHPYSIYFDVTTLPTLYLMDSNEQYYNLLHQVNTKSISIEEALLEGIKYFGY